LCAGVWLVGLPPIIQTSKNQQVGMS
jgi:hypothetical protein